jgi:heat shock protein HslJ
MKTYLLIVAIMLLSACSALKPHNDADVRINNIVWSVISYKGHSLNEADFSNGLPRISFNMKDGKISGTDGCNSFIGVAAYKGNNIKTGPIVSTKLACTSTAVPGDFYAILAADNLTWQFDDDNNLRLMVDGLQMMVLKERE